MNGIPMAPPASVRDACHLALQMFHVNGKDWFSVRFLRSFRSRDLGLTRELQPHTFPWLMSRLAPCIRCRTLPHNAPVAVEFVPAVAPRRNRRSNFQPPRALTPCEREDLVANCHILSRERRARIRSVLRAVACVPVHNGPLE